MNTLEVGARMTFLSGLAENPNTLKILADDIIKLNDGKWSQSFIDCVYQYSEQYISMDQKIDLFDIFILFKTLSNLESNYIAFQVPTTRGPYKDKRIDEMNRELKKLPSPFKAEFYGGTQDEDGFLSWSRPIHVPRLIGTKIQWCLVDTRRNIPLEVGTNSSFKFDQYMRRDHCVARWPYGQKYITVFLNTNFIKTYDPSVENFDKLLKASKESIKDCLNEDSLDYRNPWQRWKRDVSIHRNIN